MFWFEEMKKEPKKVIAEIAQHTGYCLSEEELDAIEEYTRFSRISKEIKFNIAAGFSHTGLTI